MNEDAYFTIKEFAQKIKVHESTVRRLVKKGRLNSFRIGGGLKSGYRIPASEIERIALFDMEKLIDEILEKKQKE